MRGGQRLLVFGLIAMLSLSAAPEPSGPAEVEIAIPGQASRRIGSHDLDRLPQQHADVAFLTRHGEEHGSFAGPLLWAVLDQANALPSARPRERVRRVLVVTGTDGYAVALALAEIDPEFEGKQVLYQRLGPMTRM
jgi:hypothetical protein